MAKEKRKASAYSLLVGKYMKQGMSMKAAHAKAKTGKAPGTATTYKAKAAAAVKKRYSSAPGLVKLVDDIADLGIILAAPAARVRELVEGGTWEGFLNGISMDYTGYQPYDKAVGDVSTPGIALPDPKSGWDLKKAVGLKHLITAVIRRKHQATVSKYAPIRRLGKQSLGSLISSGLGKTIAELPTILAIKSAKDFPAGRKLIRYAEMQSRYHTGIRHSSSHGGYEGFHKDDLARSLVSTGTGIGVKKLITVATKGMKFKMPRM